MKAIILMIALQYNLPPFFVLSIAMTENATLDQYAVNYNVDGTTDRGLMQLNSSYFTGSFDPYENVEEACQHIQWLRSKGYNWWQTAIAYHAGYFGMNDKPPDRSIEYGNKVMLLWQTLEPRSAEARGGR